MMFETKTVKVQIWLGHDKDVDEDTRADVYVHLHREPPQIFDGYGTKPAEWVVDSLDCDFKLTDEEETRAIEKAFDYINY